jgi:small-conductance mechanosensitive channel
MYNRRAGRIIFIPNNVIFTNPIFNYTHNGLSTVWDGIDITITFDSNYKKAVYLAKEIVTKYSKGYTDITKRRIQKLKKDYNIKNANVEPRIFTFIEENGIKISCWYLNNYTPLTLRSNISAEIIEAFNNAEDIKIAYPTYTIVKKEDEQSLKTQTPL